MRLSVGFTGRLENFPVWGVTLSAVLQSWKMLVFLLLSCPIWTKCVPPMTKVTFPAQTRCAVSPCVGSDILDCVRVRSSSVYLRIAYRCGWCEWASPCLSKLLVGFTLWFLRLIGLYWRSFILQSLFYLEHLCFLFVNFVVSYWLGRDVFWTWKCIIIWFVFFFF